jgi:hypothetical protein
MIPCIAMELEPQSWNHLPKGTNFAGVVYNHTDADIFIDPTLLLQDVEMEMETLAGKYIRTFELFKKSARVDITQGYKYAKWRGLFNGSPASTSRNGLSDTFVRFAINLYGAPPLSGKEYIAYRSGKNVETIIGIGLAVRLPTGEYMEDKLINLGDNRFSFRPQLGIIHKIGKWKAELTNEIAFFTRNDEFFNGKTLEREPLYIAHAHLSYSFRPGLTVTASLGYDYGGEDSINGIEVNNTSQNIGWALGLNYPINRYSGINFRYISTHTQEATGLDSENLSAGFSIFW